MNHDSLLCDRCARLEILEEAHHALLTCRDADIYALRKTFAYLFSQFPDEFSVEQRWLMISSCNTTTHFSFASELMDLGLTGEDLTRAKGPPECKCKSLGILR
jgi:hypothetical protein